MTLQEIFNKSYLGVIAQGKPSVDANGGCLYAGPDGTACGIGQLIDRETAEKWDALHDSSIASIILDRDVSDVFNRDMTDHVQFMSEIQYIHDDTKPEDYLASYKLRMARLANRHGLTIPTLPEGE